MAAVTSAVMVVVHTKVKLTAIAVTSGQEEEEEEEEEEEVSSSIVTGSVYGEEENK